MNEIEEVREEVLAQPAPKSTMRTVGVEELMRLQSLLKDAKKRVRVYSQMGFVPNSYRYRCAIQFIEANRVEGGVWETRIGECDAKRPYGRGALEVVDGRGV